LRLPIYEIRSLKHSYGGEPVLSIEHLTVKQAHIVGLIGPNGSGKSTLLRLLGLIERPTQGEIFFNGRRVEPFSDEARFLITLLPQEPFLMKRSVFNNVSYGLKLRGNGRDIVDKVTQALSLVGLDSKEFARRPWYALSGGEAQRVALAARLALKPKGRIFGRGRETIIFGPWQKLGTETWGKILSDKQQLPVPPPPSQEAAAVIDVLAVSEDRSTIAGEGIILSGTVSRLSLERKTGQLFATILVGDLPFKVGLAFQQGKEHTLFPGKTIFIRYRLDQVKWI
jgi:tungstate transport system ATP-binding protein